VAERVAIDGGWNKARYFGRVSVSDMLISPAMGIAFFNFSDEPQEGDTREGSTFKAQRFPFG